MLQNECSPQVLSVRKQAEVIRSHLEKRLETILPTAMRETGFDMWLIICQEDDLDPLFRTFIPMDAWCPILQMLIFYDRGESKDIERINLSMTETHGLYDQPWKGHRYQEQWPFLRKIIDDRDPRRIGINIGSVQWAAGGLTHNLYTQLLEALPAKFVSRLDSAEPMAVRWLTSLTDDEIVLYEDVVNLAHQIIGECYSREVIVPGLTTTSDLEWYYWQRCAELGLQVSFKPFFNLVRSEAERRKFGEHDLVIRPGDCIHCDTGILYLRLNTDHQKWAYVLRNNETETPDEFKKLMAQANILQDIFMGEFKQGLTGNELLKNILTRARNEGIPNPKVYSHSLGLFLHEPGPLIGLPWEQEKCEGRGDVKLLYNTAFTMELSVRDHIPEWNQEVTMSLEEDVIFTHEGCRIIGRRQTEYYLV